MLKTLYIKDVALIDEVRISFTDGFNVFSGETGAGKSILIDALGLLLGNKADKNIIKANQQFSKVEAWFELDDSDSDIYSILNEMGIDVDGTISLSRTLFSTGRSEYRINGEISTLNIFKKVSNRLLDIFGQHDNLQLLDVNNHIVFFDQYIGEDVKKKKVLLANELENLATINKEIDLLGGDSYKRAREIELLEYEIKQINDVNLKDNEDEDLFARKRLLVNAEKIHKVLSNSLGCLSMQNDIVGLLKQSSNFLATISGIEGSLDDCKNRIDSSRWEIEDIVSTLETSLSEINYDENEFNKIEDRLDCINNLKRKYGNTIDDIFNYLQQANERLEMLLNCEEKLKELDEKKQELLHKIFEISAEIHKIRQDNIKIFEKNIVDELTELGMKNAMFNVWINYFDDATNIENNINPNGLDRIEFGFSANLGQEPRSLDKIISGGELSRFCLAFKTVTNIDGVGKTLIFDEIDTGIGGNTGSVVAKKLAKISKRNQVLCITHLAQIASFADAHYKIVKIEENNRTYTSINCLKEAEKCYEISRMIGSINNSSFADLHSKELLAEAGAYKLSLA